MIERDFIMRLVREVGQMLARIVSKRADGLYEEAEQDLEDLARRHVGLDLGLMRGIAPKDLLDMLQQGGGHFISRCLVLSDGSTRIV